DEVDFHDPDLRQRPALHAAYQLCMRGVLAGRKGDRSILRVRFEDKARSAFPLFEAIGSGAYRSYIGVVSGRVDDLSAGRQERHHALHRRIVRFLDQDLNRVAIKGTQALYWSVVVEARA